MIVEEFVECLEIQLIELATFIDQHDDLESHRSAVLMAMGRMQGLLQVADQLSDLECLDAGQKDRLAVVSKNWKESLTELDFLEPFGKQQLSTEHPQSN